MFFIRRAIEKRLHPLFQKRFMALPLVDWGWILALALVRLTIGARFGLGVDEAHYAIYGVLPDWSYFDHPPLVGWIEAVFMALFGLREWAVRLPAIFSGILATVLIYRLCETITRSEVAARWGAIAMNASFLMAGLWLMFLPDTILFLLLLWLVDVTLRVKDRGARRDWLELGLCLGLAGLAKYTAVLVVPALFGFAIGERSLGRFLKPWLLGAIAVAALTVNPVFVWNYRHEWVSFKFQTAHVLGQSTLQWGQLAKFIAIQLVAFNPFVVLAASVGWANSRRLWSPSVRLALWIAMPLMAFFAFSYMREEGLPHWTHAAWGLLIPLGVALGVAAKPASARLAKLLSSLIVIGALFTLVLFSELLVRWVPYRPYQSPYADLTGWPELREDLERLLEQEAPGRAAIAVTNWTHGGRARFYWSGLAPVYVLDVRFDQNDFWEKKPVQAPNLLVVEWRGYALDPRQAERCGTLEPVAEKTIERDGRPVNSVRMLWCRDYRYDD